jgi:hypothetical protein
VFLKERERERGDGAVRKRGVLWEREWELEI